MLPQTIPGVLKLKTLSSCSPDLEFLMLNTIYRGNSHIITLVYIPQTPKWHSTNCTRPLASTNPLTQKQSLLMWVTITKPVYHQHLFCPTSGSSVLDHLYANICVTYKTIPHPHIGQSDHIPLFLLPWLEYVQRLIRPILIHQHWGIYSTYQGTRWDPNADTGGRWLESYNVY
jgi:hypothetical protein